MSSKNYLSAANTLRECLKFTREPRILTLLEEAEIRNLLARSLDTSIAIEYRLLSYEALRKNHSDEQITKFLPAGVSLTKLSEVEITLANLKKAETARKLKQELAERKKAGVRIGMTAEEVLQSSWGRPKKVNRTTTARGVDEQWVYDGGYLYFENSVLTAIQN